MHTRGSLERASSGSSPSTVPTAPKKLMATSSGACREVPALATTPSTTSVSPETSSTMAARPASVDKSAVTSVFFRSTPITR